MKKRIPNFRSEKEEAAFWDTHDSTDYWDELKEDNELVFVRPEQPIIEVKPAMYRLLLAAAKKRRTTPDRLVNRWLREKLTPSK